ncbi:MAG: tetratricopeptide repeat protein [Candidatus Hydrogenedentes bacterium]|nr:tetratricopeptide repeat protein [Candidatus Hydrogenedentota bacterium]
MFIVLAWLAAKLAGGDTTGIADSSQSEAHDKRPVVLPALISTLAALSLLACIVATRAHLPVWRDSVTLFRHSLSVTRENTVAHNNLGQALFERGAYIEAGEQFAASLQIAPGNLDALNNYGAVLLLSGKPKQAAAHFRAYLEERPQDAEVRVNMAAALFQQGRLDNARNQARHALKLRPGFAKAQQLLNAIDAAQRSARP